MATKQISATLAYDSGPSEDVTNTAVWTSSDESVATVENGVITAVRPGKCTVTVTHGEFTDTCAVTVPKPKS